jgi:type I restriction enzyme S subunit
MYPLRVRKNEINPSFFLHLLLSNKVTRYAVDCSMRVAMPKINRDALGDCWLAYPTLPEQIVIIARISSETAGLNMAIKRAQRGIDLLNEYRTRLIADVVTGKLDVREAAARLPDGEAEPKQFDTAEALIDAANAER